MRFAFPHSCVAIGWALIAAAVLVSCGRPTPPPRPPPPASRVVTVPVSLKALVFDDPSVEKTFHALLNTAEASAGPVWIHDPLTGRETSKYTTTYTTSWRSPNRIRTNPNQSPALAQEERQVLLVINVDRRQPLDVNDFRFEASHLSETDWGVVFWLAAADTSTQPQIQIRFFHPKFNTTDSGGRTFAFDWPNTAIDVSTRDGNDEYKLFIQLSETAQRNCVEAWRKQIDSPEALRDELLRVFDQLGQETSKRIAAGGVVYTDWSGVRSDNPPRDFPLGRPPPAPIATKLTALADREIDRRRQIVEQEYQAIHAALLSVFPLKEALAEEPAPGDEE